MLLRYPETEKTPLADRLQSENRAIQARPACEKLLAAATLELRRTAEDTRRVLTVAAAALGTAARAGCDGAEEALLALQEEDRLSQHLDQVARALEMAAAALAEPVPAAAGAEGESLAAALEQGLTVEAVRNRLVAAVTGQDRTPAAPDAQAGEPDLF